MDLSKEIAAVQAAAQADATRKDQPHVDLLDAIHRLTLAAEKPAETLMRMRLKPLQNAAIRMVVEGGFLNVIGEHQGKAVSASTISQKTGYDELLIERLMRLVTYCGICNEVGESQYSANEATDLINTPGLNGGEKHHYDLFFPIGTKLVEYMNETGVHQFPEKPEEKSPFEFAHGMPVWKFFQQNKKYRKYFDDYMSTRRQGLLTWHENFPMAKLLAPGVKTDGDAVLLVDIGGNKGHDISSFHKAYPNLPGRLILQDLPSMIETVRVDPPEGIELMPYDFFTPQPVKAARAYYFHSVCHDWSDAKCEIFLTKTAQAMEKGYSRLLLDEFVLPTTKTNWRAASLDIQMLMFASGMERTSKQWESLLDRCGLEIIKIWGTRSDYEQIIEVQLK
ncbi:MAG: hypothetical protein Q9214_001897 [Letrouitia sp. 1 TL-2023]